VDREAIESSPFFCYTQFMSSPDATENMIKRLLDKKQAAQAKAELRGLGEHTIPLLLCILDKERQRYTRRRRFGIWIDKAASFLFYSNILLASFLIKRGVSENTATLIAVSMIFPMLIGGVVRVKLHAVPTTIQTVYELFGEMNYVRIIAVLLDGFSNKEEGLYSLSKSLLIKALSHLTVSEWRTLKPQQHATFYRLLRERGNGWIYFDEEFALAGLKALEQAGGVEAIPTVERIAVKGRSEKVKQAAQECLSYLRVRRDEQATRETLLRASEATGGKEELLRIPAQNSDSASQQLLRVSNE
jgi:hypothetical protein